MKNVAQAKKTMRDYNQMIYDRELQIARCNESPIFDDVRKNMGLPSQKDEINRLNKEIETLLDAMLDLRAWIRTQE